MLPLLVCFEVSDFKSFFGGWLFSPIFFVIDLRQSKILEYGPLLHHPSFLSHPLQIFIHSSNVIPY